jgi:hypothetical protein
MAKKIAFDIQKFTRETQKYSQPVRLAIFRLKQLTKKNFKAF